MLTWSLGSLFGGRVLAFGLDGGRVEDPRGGAVLAEVILQAFDGAVQLVGPDLEVDVHEICRETRGGGVCSGTQQHWTTAETLHSTIEECSKKTIKKLKFSNENA